MEKITKDWIADAAQICREMYEQGIGITLTFKHDSFEEATREEVTIHNVVRP